MKWLPDPSVPSWPTARSKCCRRTGASGASSKRSDSRGTRREVGPTGTRPATWLSRRDRTNRAGADSLRPKQTAQLQTPMCGPLAGGRGRLSRIRELRTTLRELGAKLEESAEGNGEAAPAQRRFQGRIEEMQALAERITRVGSGLRDLGAGPIDLPFFCGGP